MAGTANGIHSNKRDAGPLSKNIIWWWFFISSSIVLWDAGYCLMRPRSMIGGDWFWLWSPYTIYAKVDHIYGFPAIEANDGFTNAQAVMNLVETALNFVYCYIHQTSPVAPFIGFTSAIMTLWKTVLYLSQDAFCGFCYTGHNSLSTILTIYVPTNGMWVIFPSLILLTLGREITSNLRFAASVRGKANGKSH